MLKGTFLSLLHFPMVVCIQPKAGCMDRIVNQLEHVRSGISSHNFYFEKHVPTCLLCLYKPIQDIGYFTRCFKMEGRANINVNVVNIDSTNWNSKSNKRLRHRTELERHSVASTVLRVPEAGVVVVPLTVFQMHPSGVSNAFYTDEGEIVYEEWVNVMMAVPGMRESELGTFNEFSHTWTTRADTVGDLDNLIFRLSRFPTFLGLTLVNRKLLKQNTEIPMVVCIQPKAGCMDRIVNQLEHVRSGISSHNFYFEIDVGQSVVKWASDVLGRQFACVGGRLGITNAQPFNHVWDWQDILGCLPCFCCCLLCGSFYRCHRAVWYTQVIRSVKEQVIVMGSSGLETDTQRHGLQKLIKWTKSAGGNACGRCGLRVTGPTGERCMCVKEKEERKPQPLNQKVATNTKQQLKPQFDGVSWFDLDNPAEERPSSRTDAATPSNVDVQVGHSPLANPEVKRFLTVGRNKVEPSPDQKRPSKEPRHFAREQRSLRF